MVDHRLRNVSPSVLDVTLSLRIIRDRSQLSPFEVQLNNVNSPGGDLYDEDRPVVAESMPINRGTIDNRTFPRRVNDVARGRVLGMSLPENRCESICAKVPAARGESHESRSKKLQKSPTTG